VWTEEGEEESEMTCSERLQAELQDDPGGGPPLIPIDPPDPPPSPREQDLTGLYAVSSIKYQVSSIKYLCHINKGWTTKFQSASKLVRAKYSGFFLLLLLSFFLSAQVTFLPEGIVQGF
jgi:hypothetical protein